MKRYIKYVLVAIFLLVVSSVLVLYYKNLTNTNQKTRSALILDKKNFKDYIDLNPLRNEVTPLQNYLLSDIKAGKNDDFTKSAAYWMSHRYFDNGGDIYEIYDYVKANPELAFLNEAELLVPDDFAALKKGRVENYGGPSFRAYIAYLEVLEKYGYLGLPGLSTLASKEISTVFNANKAQAYFASSSLPLEKYKEKLKSNINKSLYYAEKAKIDLDKVMKGDTSGFVSVNDAVVGLTQYASALQMYKALKIDFKSDYTTDQVFDMSAKLAKPTVLSYFTSYSRLYSYILTKEINAENVKVPLSVIYDSPFQEEYRPGTFLYRIINSKSGTTGKGIYSYETTRELAKYSPEFKDWLKKHGWVDQDF
jgi:hypothetical protein